MNYSFTPGLSSCRAILKDLQDHFNMHNLHLTISEFKLESVDAKVPMVVFYFKTFLVLLLLTDSSVMPPKNLVLNKPVTCPDGSLDVTPWFLPFKSDGMKVDDVLSGKWFNDIVLSPNDPNCFYCPLIMYVDWMLFTILLISMFMWSFCTCLLKKIEALDLLSFQSDY